MADPALGCSPLVSVEQKTGDWMGQNGPIPRTPTKAFSQRQLVGGRGRDRVREVMDAAAVVADAHCVHWRVEPRGHLDAVKHEQHDRVLTPGHGVGVKRSQPVGEAAGEVKAERSADDERPGPEEGGRHWRCLLEAVAPRARSTARQWRRWRGQVWRLRRNWGIKWGSLPLRTRFPCLSAPFGVDKF